MKYLYLAEKPSAMKDVKAAYNASSKPLGDIDFFALTGHICRLCEPKEYEDWDVRWADQDKFQLNRKYHFPQHHCQCLR